MNSTPAHSYNAVPSMLTVAPIGSTNDVTRFDTPTLFSTAFIVTGSVAPDELVENAITSGSTMFRK